MNDTLSNFKVTDRNTFIEFLELLRKDLLLEPESWQNKTLPDFLEAFGAFTEDIQEYYDTSKRKVNAEKADWQTFADILKGARMYEPGKPALD
jgi:hypothetical protein